MQTVKTVAVATPQTPDVFVINNIPSIPTGSSSYVQSSSYPELSLIDADRLASQVLQLYAAASQAQSDHRAETLEVLTKLVEIQKPIAEIIARGQAAQIVLDAAGLDEQDSYLPQDGDNGGVNNLIQQMCAQCHTGEAAKADFRLDQPFDVTKAIVEVSAKRMPKDTAITEAQRWQLIGEFAKLLQENQE